jgi:large subunit ribosomal protein L21
MDKYAVLRIKGNQYSVKEGQEFLVSFLGDDKPEYEVLLISDGKEVKVGKPTLDVKVSLKVITPEEKGEKVEVFKYKSKSRFRKHTGFRAKYTRLQVEKIG